MAGRAEEQFSEWTKIPKRLQHQFFELAEEEAQRTKQQLLKNQKKLERMREQLKFKNMPKNDAWNEMSHSLVWIRMWTCC